MFSNQTIEQVGIILPVEICATFSADNNQSIVELFYQYTPKVLIAIANLISILGNSLVIITISFNIRLRRTVTSLLLLSLSISNLIFSSIVVPVHVFDPVLSESTDFGCKSLAFLQTTSVLATAQTLVAIAVERYFAICRTMESLGRQTVTHVYPLIMVIWILSLVISVPVAIAIQSSQYHCPSKMIYGCVETNWASYELDKIYTTGLFVIIVLIPSVAMGLMYYNVAKVLANSRVQTLRVHCSVKKGQSSRESKNTVTDAKTLPASSTKMIDFDNNKEQEEDAELNKNRNPTEVIPNATVLTPLVLQQDPRPQQLEITVSGDDITDRSNTSADDLEAVITSIEVTTVTAVRANDIQQQAMTSSSSSRMFQRNAKMPVNESQGHRTVQRPEPCRDANHHPGLQRQQSVSELLMKSGQGVVNWRSRLVYMLIVIVVGHVACWGPIHLMQVVLRMSSTEFQATPLVRNTMSVAYFLENISGCINPIAFCFMSQGFRTTFVNLYTKIKNFRTQRRT